MATVARKSSNKYPPAYFGSPPSPNPLESDDEEPVYPANTENCSSSEEDTADDEQTVMVQFFKKIYKDPHQDIMEMLDGHAAEVLRTGRITVAGNAGGES